jgi:tetratricopeptide (TPR) repeat protein
MVGIAMATLADTLALGLQHHLAGNLAAAEPLYRQVLHTDPGEANARYLLDLLLCHGTRRDAIVPLLRRAVALLPQAAVLHWKLGQELVDLGQVEEAAACYREALRLQPDLAEAHANLAELLLEEGRREEATSCYHQALRLDPGCVSALSQAAIYNVFPLTSLELARMGALASDARLSRTDAARLHFGLGNVHDRAGAYEEAFRHFQQANALRQAACRDENQGYDAAAHNAWTSEMIASCNARYFQRIRGFGRDSQRPVFIVGMLRSGTSLVEQILASHPQIHGAGELFDITALAIGLPCRLGVAARSDLPGEAYPACLATLDAATATALADEYLSHLERLDSSAPRVTDKMPTNFEHLGLIAALSPRARVIHCSRDPLDVCLSCYFQHFTSMNFTYALEDLAAFYQDYERLMRHWQALLPLAFLEVAYEDLVSAPERVSRELVAFCDLEWDDRCLAYHQTQRRVRTASMAQVRQPIYTRSVGRWRHYAAHLGPLLRALGRE